MGDLFFVANTDKGDAMSHIERTLAGDDLAGFATRAEIRGITRVQPTYERLHLKFLDRQAPDRLLRQ